MLKLFKLLNLNIAKVETKGNTWLQFFTLFILTIFLITASQSGLAKYSADSWAYFELAKTIFSDNFYKFNTYRSYFSETQSAAFPFGYPIALAIVNKIFSFAPINAIYLNVTLSVASIILIIKICKNNGISKIATLSVVAAFSLNPAYMDEVFSGRAIPLALFIFLLASFILIGRYSSAFIIFSGILFGATALVRFDFLLIAFLLMNLFLFLEKKEAKSFLLANGGFVIGIFPWCIYSAYFFNKFWISDNSWVVLSAIPAFVLDFPAQVSSGLFTDPVSFLKKIGSNTIRLMSSLLTASSRQPLFLFSLALMLYVSRFAYPKFKQFTVITIATLFVSLLPYVLTGYFDSRYFLLFFLVSTFLLIACWSKLVNDQAVDNSNNHLYSASFLSTAAMLLLGMIFVGRVLYFSKENFVKFKINETIISSIDCSHKRQPNTTLIFTESAVFLAPMYGALTGNKAAFLPSNFDRMSDPEKSAYFSYMHPFKLITNAEVDLKCDN